MSVRIEGNPLSVQDRMRDMQSLLILQSIRGKHDEEPTVLAALDHAIGIIKKRMEKVEKDPDDIRLQFLKSAVSKVERGEAHITNIGVSREVGNFTSIDDSAVRSAPVGPTTYTIEITGDIRP